MQDRVYPTPVHDVADLRQRLIDACCKALWTMLMMNGVRDFRPCVDETLTVIFRLKCRPIVRINWIFFILCNCNDSVHSNFGC